MIFTWWSFHFCLGGLGGRAGGGKGEAGGLGTTYAAEPAVTVFGFNHNPIVTRAVGRKVKFLALFPVNVALDLAIF